jgi:hypothetical protein
MFRVRRPRLPQTRQEWRRLLTRAAAYTAGWAVIAVPVAVYGFLHDTRTTVVASHDATVSPTLDGWATVNLGAYLPNVRYPTHRTFGVEITLGKTNLDSYEQCPCSTQSFRARSGGQRRCPGGRRSARGCRRRRGMGAGTATSGRGD